MEGFAKLGFEVIAGQGCFPLWDGRMNHQNSIDEEGGRCIQPFFQVWLKSLQSCCKRSQLAKFLRLVHSHQVVRGNPGSDGARVNFDLR